MTESDGVDAPETTSTEPETVSKAEATRAYTKRDEAKAEAKELRTKLATFEAAAADAASAKAKQDGDLQAQIDLLQKSNEVTVAELGDARAANASMHKTARKGEVLSLVLASVPDATFHKMASASLDSFLSSALDGDEDPADVAAKAVEQLQALAPQILETPKPGAKTHGLIPSDRGARPITESESSDEHTARMQKTMPGWRNPLAPAQP